MENIAKKTFVKCIKEVLRGQIKYSANSTSCWFVCEPKAPESLEKYKQKRNSDD